MIQCISCILVRIQRLAQDTDRIHRIRTEYNILKDTHRIHQDTSDYIRIQFKRTPPIFKRKPSPDPLPQHSDAGTIAPECVYC